LDITTIPKVNHNNEYEVICLQIAFYTKNSFSIFKQTQAPESKNGKFSGFIPMGKFCCRESYFDGYFHKFVITVV
jgi:hypothetical protein